MNACPPRGGKRKRPARGWPLKAGEERKIEIVLNSDVWNYWIPGEGWTKDIGDYIITASTDSQHKDVKWELTVK